MYILVYRWLDDFKDGLVFTRYTEDSDAAEETLIFADSKLHW